MPIYVVTNRITFSKLYAQNLCTPGQKAINSFECSKVIKLVNIRGVCE